MSHINSQFASNRIIFDSAGFFSLARKWFSEKPIYCGSVGTSLIISWTNHFHRPMRKAKYFLLISTKIFSQSALSAPVRSESGLLLRSVGQWFHHNPPGPYRPTTTTAALYSRLGHSHWSDPSRHCALIGWIMMRCC